MVTAVQEDRIAMEPINVASRISSALKPSTPIRYWAPIDGIHSCRSTNCQSGVLMSSQNHSGSDTRNPSPANTFAIQRIAFVLFLFTNSSSTAPARGVNMISDSRGKSSGVAHEQVLVTGRLRPTVFTSTRDKSMKSTRFTGYPA